MFSALLFERTKMPLSKTFDCPLALLLPLICVGPIVAPEEMDKADSAACNLSRSRWGAEGGEASNRAIFVRQATRRQALGLMGATQLWSTVIEEDTELTSTLKAWIDVPDLNR